MQQSSAEEMWREFGVSGKQWEDPQWQMRNSIREPGQLQHYANLNDTQLHMIEETVRNGRPMRITPYYASLMGNNPTGVGPDGVSVNDEVSPIFLQAVPTPDQYLFKAGAPDPMSEGSRSVGAVYQRYGDRVALKVNESSACHTFCTHCQRGKDFEEKAYVEDLEAGLRYIRDNDNISEVLVTGGDALTLSEFMLSRVLRNLSEIDHVESVRIASRLPVTNPFAVEEGKLEIIGRYSKHTGGNPDFPNIYMVTHANAPEELTADMQEAVSRTRRSGLDVRNQTVLLNGVNDDFSKLSRMMKELHHMGIDPRYLFECHKVGGMAAKVVPINVGQALVSELRGQEGSSIPTYAVNMVGGGGKVVLTPQGDQGIPDFEYRLSRPMRTWDNRVVEYEELMRVRESDYDTGMEAMSRFYGDASIMDSETHYIDGLEARETSSGKYRPSVIVVDDNDPSKVLYVTNVTAPKPLGEYRKHEAMGLTPNGAELGLPEQPFVTDPGKLNDLYT